MPSKSVVTPKLIIVVNSIFYVFHFMLCSDSRHMMRRKGQLQRGEREPNFREDLSAHQTQSLFLVFSRFKVENSSSVNNFLHVQSYELHCFSGGFAEAVLMPRATGEQMQLDRYGPGT